MTPEPSPRCAGCAAGAAGPAGRRDRRKTGGRSRRSGVWNWAGAALAFPSVRIVTTAGATTLTMSAYESRAAGNRAGRSGGGGRCRLLRPLLDDGVRRHAARRRPSRAAWRPRRRRPCGWPMAETRNVNWSWIVFLSGLAASDHSALSIRRDTALLGRCRNITNVKGGSGHLVI